MPSLREVPLATLRLVRVTRCDSESTGSISIDANLLETKRLRVNERMLVREVENASRFESCVRRAEPGSGEIGIRGGAVRLTANALRVRIISFGLTTGDEISARRHTVANCDAERRDARAIEHEPG